MSTTFFDTSLHDLAPAYPSLPFFASCAAKQPCRPLFGMLRLIKHGQDAHNSALQSPLKWFCPKESSSKNGQGESDLRAHAPKDSAFSRFKICIAREKNEDKNALRIFEKKASADAELSIKFEGISEN